MSRTKLIVVDECMLCSAMPGSTTASVLHASVLKGSDSYAHMRTVHVHEGNHRLASEKDFDDFRVCFNGFNNPSKYEFDITPKT